jgi:hypothetical protein
MSAAARSSDQTALKRLAAALAFVCLVLLTLAVDSRQAGEVWAGLQDVARPVAGRLWGWSREALSGRGEGLSGLKQAWRGDGSDILAADPAPAVLAGEFRPADEATRAATGGVAFVGSALRFERGGTLRTVPLRIATGREAFVHGQTFAARLEAGPDAQIELRRFVPQDGAREIASSPLCGGDSPAGLAVMHRRRQVDLILFRQGMPPGPEAPETIVCGVWRYRQ